MSPEQSILNVKLALIPNWLGVHIVLPEDSDGGAAQSNVGESICSIFRTLYTALWDFYMRILSTNSKIVKKNMENYNPSGKSGV